MHVYTTGSNTFQFTYCGFVGSSQSSQLFLFIVSRDIIQYLSSRLYIHGGCGLEGEELRGSGNMHG